MCVHVFMYVHCMCEGVCVQVCTLCVDMCVHVCVLLHVCGVCAHMLAQAHAILYLVTSLTLRALL